MNRRFYTVRFIVADWLSAAIAWALFYDYRKTSIELTDYNFLHFLHDEKFVLGWMGLPLLWVTFYALTGAYTNVFRKSRLKEIGQTFLLTLIGVLIIFFALLLDDSVNSYVTYYYTFFTLFALHYICTTVFRIILATGVIRHIKHGKIGFNTVMIGSNQKALDLLNQLNTEFKSEGHYFVGYVHIDGNNDHLLAPHLKNLGTVPELSNIIRKYRVEEAIIALESSEHVSIGNVINALEDTSVIVRIIPDMYDILSGSVKMNAIFGAPLIEISPDLMPTWQQSVKRMMDIVLSLFVLILFFPLYLFTAIGVLLSSPGPIFYSHERIGWHGKPFRIYKFRSMRTDAEKAGPQLSSKDDPRMTRFGKWMRKIRLDEIPQFWNVLIGDMSIVGPRPERQYFIDQIMKKAPHYRHLHKVRPGITSWGQVKFGYAENVEQMVERLKFDLIYIENMTLAVDFKIMIYTVLIIVRHKGK